MGAGDNNKVFCKAATAPKIPGSEKHPTIGETDVVFLKTSDNTATTAVFQPFSPGVYYKDPFLFTAFDKQNFNNTEKCATTI